MRRPSVTFVVMAGGKGERLWPLVRRAMPKVCLSLDGVHTLLQATIERLGPAWPGARWLIVTTNEQAGPVRACLPSSLRQSVLVEPKIKNTAACITLAAVALATREPSRVMVVVPADHWVGDVPAFRRAIRAAILAAVQHDTLAMIGIRPTHPHPGLGYLLAGAPLDGPWRRSGPRVFRLTRFIEKPSETMARRLLRRPRTYWNSGTFVGTADKFLECITEWLPDHVRRLIPLAPSLRGRQGPGSASFTVRATTAYRTLEPVSFDHGVMDHLHGGVVVEGRFPWADLGSWDIWARLGQASSHTIQVDSHNVTVVGQEHLVATIGVHGLLVVHTPSATLICRPDQTQRVRDVVKRLESDRRFSPYR